MGRYLIKRLAEAVVTLVGVAVLVFIVMRVLPGNEITGRFGIETGALTETQRRSLERYYGIDEPLIGQFFSWVRSVLTGNFGISVTSGQPVRKLIVEALPVTIELAVLSTIIGSLVGVAIGVFAAARVNRVGDVVGQGFGLVGLGHIPRLVAPKAQAFGVKVIAYDPYAKPEVFKAAGVESVDFDTLLKTSDYVSVHAPLMPATPGRPTSVSR